MVLTRITVCIVASLVIVSTLLARIQDVVRLDSEVMAGSMMQVGLESIPGAEPNHVIWFVQISDIHLSIFQDSGRAIDFSRFLRETVDAIRPAVVLATGDLTDARTPDRLGSKQYLEEWKLYWNILNETGIKDKYWDIRGNHDNFNVLFPDSKYNYYQRFSVRGHANSRSYIFFEEHAGDTYAFVGMDACMNPGPKRPFNFLGVITEEEYENLEKLAKMARSNASVVIWFGHYPTSTIAAPARGLRNVMNGPYLCGHLHTLGGLIHQMYGLQTSGYLELELGDWKDNRRFRVAAVDHRMFSFVDLHLDEWPIILVTNPKHALYTMPMHEPLQKITESTHIRILVFAMKPIRKVTVKINDEDWRNATCSAENFYVVPWTPLKYSSGLHTLHVTAEDEGGSRNSVEHPFSVDGQSRPSFPKGAQLVLRGHISVFQILFGIALMGSVIPLCILRCLHVIGKARSIRTHAEESCMHRLLFKLYLISSIDRLFWPLVLSFLYVGIGPWFIGEIIDGHIGICFVWGLIIAGSFLPGGLTFVIGTLFMLTVFLPMTLCLSNSAYLRYRNLCERVVPTYSFPRYLWHHCGVLVLVTWQLTWAVGFYLSYGLLAMFFGMLNTWAIVLFLFLWRLSATLPKSCFPYLPRPRSHGGSQWSGDSGSIATADDAGRQGADAKTDDAC